MKPTAIAMIPARMGSQRLARKNLRSLKGIPLITHAIRKAVAAHVFEQVWVNSEHATFGEIAAAEGVMFHQRPQHLASETATSEEFIYEFLVKHPCEFLFQVHSIAPLLTVEQLTAFVETMRSGQFDVLLSVVLEQIECAYQGTPINFSLDRKTNSQELEPIQRITWSVTAWRRETFMAAHEKGTCATYAGRIGYFPIDRIAGLMIKTESDLRLAASII